MKSGIISTTSSKEEIDLWIEQTNQLIRDSLPEYDLTEDKVKREQQAALNHLQKFLDLQNETTIHTKAG